MDKAGDHLARILHQLAWVILSHIARPKATLYTIESPNQDRRRRKERGSSQGRAKGRRAGGGGTAGACSSCSYPESPCARQTPCRAEKTFPLAVLEPACTERQEKAIIISWNSPVYKRLSGTIRCRASEHAHQGQFSRLGIRTSASHWTKSPYTQTPKASPCLAQVPWEAAFFSFSLSNWAELTTV